MVLSRKEILERYLPANRKNRLIDLGVSLAYIHSERYNFVWERRLYADQLVIVTAILIVLLSALFALLQAR